MSKQGPPKHQNRYVWKPNAGIKINETEPGGRLRPLSDITGVCQRCRDQIDWKRKYGKYKPLSEPSKCQRCSKRTVRQAYHSLCTGCAKEHKVCAKCCCRNGQTVGRDISEVEAEQKMLEEAIKNARERERRSLLRAMNKGKSKGPAEPQACQDGNVPDLFPVSSLEEYAELKVCLLSLLITEQFSAFIQKMSDQAQPPPPANDVPPPEEAPPASIEVASATPPLSETAPEAVLPDPPAVAATREAEESVAESGSGKKTFIQPAVSFKEESYFVSDLSESERRALDELKKLVRESIADLAPPSSPPQQPSSSKEVEVEDKSLPTIESTLQEAEEQAKNDAVPEVSIWGVPLLEDERTDVVLLKFLRARDFRVKESFEMMKKTLIWRKEFGIDELVEEDLGDDLEKVVFMHGRDKEGHPVCYNVYGEFQNKELYGKTFSTQEKREKFLRWRIQFLERSIRKLLDFRPGGVNTIFQVNDLRNAPGPGKRELRQATRQALHLLQDNYPEFVAKQVFINVPWWHVAFYTMMSPIMTQRTKSKFVFVGASKTADTLFKYISPEQVPIPYGGLCVDMCECNPEFTLDDPATEISIKPTTKQFVEILVSEKCIILWELRVVSWEVTYSAEFVPKSKDAYTIVIQKATKMSPNDDPVISGSFKISDLGKIVLTVDNPAFKKKRLIYRYKVLPYSD